MLKDKGEACIIPEGYGVTRQTAVGQTIDHITGSTKQHVDCKHIQLLAQ